MYTYTERQKSNLGLEQKEPKQLIRSDQKIQSIQTHTLNSSNDRDPEKSFIYKKQFSFNKLVFFFLLFLTQKLETQVKSKRISLTNLVREKKDGDKNEKDRETKNPVPTFGKC
ncbi:hypothetical protein ACOSP7_032375 [Xanthoceras sorbifolium]